MKLINSIIWHLKRSLKSLWFFFRIRIFPLVEISGVKLILKKEWSFNVKDHIIRKDYETGEIEIIKDKLNKTDIVLEIGTGLGFLAVYCSKIVGAKNVTSVEANPYLEAYHNEIFKLNNEYPHILYNSVGNNDQETLFYIDEKNFWSSSLIPFKAQKLKEIKVKNIDINYLIDSLFPSFLIIDVEGFEFELIRMVNDFKSISKIQIETHPQIIGEEKINKMVDLLIDKGFAVNSNFSEDNQYFFSKI